MRKFAVLSAALAFSGSAYAADMAVKAPPPPPVTVSTWTGFYVGGNIGYGTARTSADVSPADAATEAAFGIGIAAGTTASVFNVDGGGLVGGVQAGYNWQLKNIVFGIEADFQGSSLKKSDDILGAPPGFTPILNHYSENVTSLGTARARIGALISPDLLGYVTGGFAYAKVDQQWDMAFLLPGPIIGTSGALNGYESGWTVGSGLEWALSSHWYVGAEYLFVRLDGRTFSNSSFFSAPGFGGFNCGTGPAGCNFNIAGQNTDINILRARLSYKF